MDTLLERYLDTMSRQKVYPSKENLRFYLRRLFREIPLRGSNVLDVGGGSGLFTLYAAVAGAAKAICLEPELDGSTAKASSAFQAMKASLGLANAELIPKPLEEFESPPGVFNVVLLHASINHLDEWATIHLTDDLRAEATYEQIARKLHSLMAPRGRIIIVDCSSSNLFAGLRMKNPLAPTIEWHKHQPPRVWAAVFAKAGFRNPRIQWNSFNSLRTPGQLLFANKIGAFLSVSGFRLELERA